MVLLVAIGSLTSAVSAAQINVTSGADIAGLQGLYDNAADDVEIIFNNGTYNDVKLVVNKTVKIHGNGATLNANGTAPIFEIKTGDKAELYNNIQIYNLTLVGSTAITVRGGTDISLKSLTLTGNNISTGYGIDAKQGVNGLFIDNVSVIGFRDALGVGGGLNTIISNSTFKDNGRNAMSFFQNAANITVTNNILDNASFGIFYGGGVKNVVISGNTITNMTCQAIALVKAANSTIIANNTITNNQIGLIIKAGDENHGEPTDVNDIFVDNNTIADNYLIGILLENIPEFILNSSKLNITVNNNITNNGIGYKENYYDLQTGSGWSNEIGTAFNVVKTYLPGTSLEPIIYVTVQVPVEVIKEVIKEVPSNATVVEVIKEVPVEIIKEVIVEVIKEVPINVPENATIVNVTKDVIKEVIKEVPVNVIKEVPVEVIKEVPVNVPGPKEIKTKNVQAIVVPTVKVSKATIKKGKKVTITIKLKNYSKTKTGNLSVAVSKTSNKKSAIVNGKKTKTIKFTVKITKKGTNKIAVYLNGVKFTTLKVKGI
ncbi:right-handed parallel beta-helix repeat-containing protein [Methanobrevibacter filiformis]|uniref:Right handed beta helix domain-containing protein n=1 Tax=Methanobrevibacter filiformis TaxID=55758 RepID=A0A166DAW5_9EURY|nr:right-handed parallel beta-helix repeat-containing protein [Methanobrevibacter filiformis]KZX15392.1 hypothetical protein MBFIL_06930 [Methanobrevibacter filiformis]